MPTAIGSSAGLLIRMKGMMNCDQPRMALRTKAEVRPGRLSGRIDPHEGAEARAAVDHGGVFEALRDAVEEALQHPGEERRGDRDVDERGAELAVGQADLVHVAVERHHDHQRRDHLEGEQADHHQVAAAKAEARQGIGRRRGEEHRAERAGDRELEAVPEVASERAGGAENADEILEGRLAAARGGGR